jgi:hypothetical protein
MFITNAKALSFDVNITKAEDEELGKLGTIERMDLVNNEFDILFEDIGAEVSFTLTITNSGNRAGTLRDINIESTYGKIEYTTSLPDGGLSINGEDTNEILITARLKEGARNKTSTSVISINYSYDEGSCPDGEVLSNDESMCLCPDGLSRNDKGVCIKPEKDTTDCATDEIYNETTKKCEKKAAPTPDPTPSDSGSKSQTVVPSNPKTLDNIILVTLLFIVSGLGIYAVMYKRLKTNKKKIVVGVLTGIITLGSSFTVLASVFGLDNLLSAIVNPITKSKTLVLTMHERVDLIETWDGGCSVDPANLSPETIFDGGSGTPADPYQIRTGEQLACLAKSVNTGTTYEGQYIKQTRNIKLNDHLVDTVDRGESDTIHLWSPIGYTYYDSNNSTSVTRPFSGTYDGDNHTISGLYLNNDSYGDYKGMFGCTVNATIKNLTIYDAYLDTTSSIGTLVGEGLNSLTIENVTTYGKATNNPGTIGGLVAYFTDSGPSTPGKLRIDNVENNIDFLNGGSTKGGIIGVVSNNNTSDEPNMIIRNAVNNGDMKSVSTTAGIVGVISNPFTNVLIENAVNNGNFYNDDYTQTGGIIGYFQPLYGEIKNSYNTGNFEYHPINSTIYFGGIIGSTGGNSGSSYKLDNCFNSGNVTFSNVVNGVTIGDGINLDGMTDAEFSPYALLDNGYFAGLVANNGLKATIINSYNTGNFTTIGMVGGLIGSDWGETCVIENSYNEGNITATGPIAGLVANGGNVITKSYNKGTLVLFANSSAIGGLVGYRSRNSAVVTNSYNEGNIIVTAKVDWIYAGGLCAHCQKITNSYNRGNITSEYAGGMLSSMSPSTLENNATNVYNSGNITVRTKARDTGTSGASILVGGFQGSNGNIYNAYNLGDLTIERNESYYNYNTIGGIIAVSGGTKTNVVNTGNITFKTNVPFAKHQTIYLSGLGTSAPSMTKGFNAGTITVDDSALDHRITTEVIDGNKHEITIGEITTNYIDSVTNNKFNTNANNRAIGCLYTLDNGLYTSETTETCNLTKSELVGQYTNDNTPDILSIINADSDDADELPDNAFELKEGETLPTLKVFNE